MHNAAYRALGLAARYDWREVGIADLPEALENLEADIRGLSLTMPLKEAILPLVPDHRGLVDELAAANTLVRHGGETFLWNSDPAGIIGALAAHGVVSVTHGVILGAGATARSAVRALSDIGAREVTIVSRDQSRADGALAYAASRGLQAHWASLEDPTGITPGDLVVSTLPHGVDIPPSIAAALSEDAALLDVTYHPWPSALARAWSGSAHPVISGAQMLLYQAVIQVRLFTSGDSELLLPNEQGVIDAMRQALPHG